MTAWRGHVRQFASTLIRKVGSTTRSSYTAFKVFEDGCRIFPQAKISSHSTSHFLLQAYWICEDDGMCSLSVSFRGTPTEHVWLLLFPLWKWWLKLMGCTVFIDGGCILLISEAHLWLMFGDWAISVQSGILWAGYDYFLSTCLDQVCWDVSRPADSPFFNGRTAVSTSLRRKGWLSSVAVWGPFSTDGSPLA